MVVEREATAGWNRERAGLEINGFAVCAPLPCDSGSPSPSLGLGGGGLGRSGWMPWEQEIQWWDEMVRSLIHSWCQGNA